MRSLLKSIEAVSEDELLDYKITVHGIKGASLDICAVPIGETAGVLEKAAIDGDFDYIRKHNQAFLESAQDFFDRIDEMLSAIVTENNKPKKIQPDSDLLKKLLDACVSFDIDAAEAAMKEIERYQYTSDDNLVEWLRENVDMTNLEKIRDRLTNIEGI